MKAKVPRWLLVLLLIVIMIIAILYPVLVK